MSDFNPAPMPNTSEDVDKVIKTEMAFHLATYRPAETNAINVTNCQRCGDLWPCQYVIQASITLKLTAIAAILQADQLAIMQGVVGNGNTSRQGKGR